MADLDDFFARKDRAKKTKKKSSVPMPTLVNPEEPNPQEEERVSTSTIEVPKRKDPILNVKIGDEDEGEWKEIEYEKDYSGLKIQSLTIKDKEEELREQKLQEATEQFEIKMTESGGPWNKNTKSDTKNADQSSDEEVEEKEVEEKKEEKEMPVPPTTAPKSGTYVPPHLRNKDSSSSATAASSTTSDGLTPMKMSSLKGRVSTASRAPAIENTMEFPSLGQEAAAPVVADTGHAVWRDTSRTSAPLKTENRYDALKKAGRD